MPEPAPRRRFPLLSPRWPAPPHSTFGSDPFFGRFGLRAVWGILLFCFLYVFFTTAAVPTLIAAAGAVFHVFAPVAAASARPDLHAPIYLLYGTLTFASLVFSAWLLSRIEDRPIGVYGIARCRLRDVLPGAFWGLASMSLLIAVLRAAHLLVFDSRALAGRSILTSGTLWLLTFFAVGLCEEYTFRGYLQFTLTRGFFGLAERVAGPLDHARARPIAFWIAAVLMSLVFSLDHILNPGETAPGIAAVFLAGLVFSYALWRTGSLWWGIGFHTAWDWAQSFLYGVPDSGSLSAHRLFLTHPTGSRLLSGGIDGPEGSLLVLPTFLLVLLIIRFTTRPGDQPPLPPASAHPALSSETGPSNPLESS